jgi:hypothetical protein
MVGLVEVGVMTIVQAAAAAAMEAAVGIGVMMMTVATMGHKGAGGRAWLACP